MKHSPFQIQQLLAYTLSIKTKNVCLNFGARSGSSSAQLALSRSRGADLNGLGCGILCALVSVGLGGCIARARRHQQS